jgi:serine carboxypeptidase-like clade 2
MWALLVLSVAALACADNADLVTSLPGLDQMPPFKIYAGYLNINTTTGKVFFYTLVEAATNPETAPLVRFFNGGPGCSSVGGGMFEELGPLIPGANGTLRVNPYSFNTAANVLFIESPVGVGFSFSKTNSDYTSSDASTAQDNYVAMQVFLFSFFELRCIDTVCRSFWPSFRSTWGATFG